MRFAYLFFTSLFIIPWAVLFLWRRDTRREMLWAGLAVLILGLLAEKMWYTRDWVNPITVTGTLVGIEDAIMGFTTGGIAAVIYKEIFRRNEYCSKNQSLKSHQIAIAGIIFGLIIADFLFRFLGLFSFFANLVGFGIIAIIFLVSRPDLIKESSVGGLLLVIASLPIYWASFYIFPLWRESYWRADEISGLLFLGIPYEDLVWWFFAGINIAMAHDYYFNCRLRKLPKALEK